MNKALFLDRDGVINEDYGYVYELEKLVIVDGIVELCQSAMKKGYMIFVVTNQSGIGRGYYTEGQFWAFMEEIQKYFKKYDVAFTKVYFSPYHPQAKDGKYLEGEEFRKPSAGMILRAEQEFNVDLGKSVLIGDKMTDIQAGLRGGIGRNILFTGKFEDVL